MNEPRLLFVDDDQEDHMIMLQYFRDAACEKHVKFLTNGQQALDYLEAIDEPAHLPRLIVLDLNMPILNGSQTLFQIKKNRLFKDIPIVIFSTSENEIEKRKCLSMGALDYWVKPVTYREGLEIVERLKPYIV